MTSKKRKASELKALPTYIVGEVHAPMHPTHAPGHKRVAYRHEIGASERDARVVRQLEESMGHNRTVVRLVFLFEAMALVSPHMWFLAWHSGFACTLT